MAQELIYTSFPKGVKPGVSGFCTVAVSPDMAPNMISRLEGLSGYRHLFMPGTPEADLNPPNWSHVVISVGNAESHVIYRVADAGLDYTGRSNKLGHFIVLDKSDLAPCGPAAMLTTPGLIDLAFDQQVGTRAFTRQIPRQLVSPRPCLAWRNAAGDPGWAGELAQTAWTGKYACIVYKPGMNVLALIQEAMALLPPERRWKTTFSTYYSKLPTGIECQWRCAAAGTLEAAQAIAEVGSGLVIDLSNGTLAPAADSPAVAAARAGRMVLAPAGQKPDAAVTRRRPVQTSRPAAEAAVNAGIQEELQTINSAPANDPEAELINEVDSLPRFTFNSPRKRKTHASTGIKYGLFAAILAGFILLGIGAASLFFMKSNSSHVSKNAVAVNKTNQVNEADDETTSEVDDEQSELNTDTDQNSTNNQEEEAAPVTELDVKSDQDQKSEEEEKARQEEEEKARQEMELAQQKAIEKARQEAELKAMLEKEAKIKAKREAEEKVFNDPRWYGADRKQFFIFIDSDNNPDCSRLNLQLQKQKLQIVKLELVPIYKDDSGFPGFELEQDVSDDLSYVVVSNGLSTDIVIRLNNSHDESPADESKSNSNQQNISIEGGGDVAFTDLIQQNVLQATFSDDSTKIISFFKITTDDDLKSALVQAANEKSINGATYAVQIKGMNKDFTISDIKFGCIGKTITVNNKPFNIDTSLSSIENSVFELRIELNKFLKESSGGIDDAVSDSAQNKSSSTEIGDKIDLTILKNLVVWVENERKSTNTAKIYRFKYAFDIEQNRKVKTVKIEEYNREYSGVLSRSKQDFSRQIKMYAAALPLYIDVSVQGDPLADNAASKSFLWKRIVLPVQK